MIRKTVLLGMNNPDPKDAFRAQKKTGSGYRLLSFMNEYLFHTKTEISAYDFERMFDRQNVLDEKEWDPFKAAKAAPDVIERLKGRRVVTFGAGVRDALELPRDMDTGQWFTQNDAEWCMFPHPSGLNRVFNDVHQRIKVGKVLWQEFMKGAEWYTCYGSVFESRVTNVFKTKWSYPPT
ncbi:hypothetical protein PP935_gp093 [Rhizobium phage RHph_N34]|uniref:Uncharacterized protein n=1 Tax=Rhizobium phage RHph_N34 TaxID=2509586 RepID=A0A7S5UZX2_9CAUD|nr:hypothetical protein PP935_gp093 [Rhizobium phage RHph_N34]QIG73868.1 hypothetical protein EVC06_093 [Rhizobium phage RHph_N34]